MKKLFLMILFSLPVLVACSDDENEMKVELNNAVLEFIDSKYQGAKLRSSEYEKNGLLEVEIMHDGKVKDVYFDSQSKWVYTSWDVRKADLPQVVTGALTEAYPDYVIDEADYVERENIEYYAVEMDKGKVSIMVYVSPDGVILEATEGEPGTKPVISDAVRSFISEHYPNATIKSYDYDANGLLEVDILDGNVEKDVYFDSNDNWVQTDWDVRVSALPEAVLQTIAGNYPEYTIDSAEYVERPDNVVFYEIELEKAGGQDIVVNVTAEGVVLE